MSGGKDQWLRCGDYGISFSQRAVSQSRLKAASLSEDLVKKAPVPYLQVVQFHVLRQVGHAPPLINQWVPYFVSNERRHDERQRVAVTQASCHSFPLKDLMDSLRYKNRPAVHYVMPPLCRAMCTAPLYQYISYLTGPEVDLRWRRVGGWVTGWFWMLLEQEMGRISDK